MTLTDDELEFMRERGEYYDTHDVSDTMNDGPEVDFDSSGARIRIYFEVERELEKQLRVVAKTRGISATDLLNEWVRENLAEVPVKPAEDGLASLDEWERLLGAADDHMVAARAGD